MSDARKTIDDNFTDWEGEAFGYGYGTGEAYTLPALKTFMELCPVQAGGTYDHEKLEAALTPAVAWLLIGILARANIIEYGTSPRFGWLSKQGYALQAYLKTKTAEDLYALTCRDSDYIHCYPGMCNCLPVGCANPFWAK